MRYRSCLWFTWRVFCWQTPRPPSMSRHNTYNDQKARKTYLTFSIYFLNFPEIVSWKIGPFFFATAPYFAKSSIHLWSICGSSFCANSLHWKKFSFSGGCHLSGRTAQSKVSSRAAAKDNRTNSLAPESTEHSSSFLRCCDIMDETHLLSLTSNIGMKQNGVYVKDSQCLGILFEFFEFPLICFHSKKLYKI